MKQILVEEWVHIPEGGKKQLLTNFFLLSYHYCEVKNSKSEGTKRRNRKELQTHGSRIDNLEASH